MMRPIDAVQAVILAGGQSSRMGQNKALLSFQGQTLLQRNIQLLQQLGLPVLISGQYEGYPCIADQYAQLGPLAGLHAVDAGLAPTKTTLLCMPVDMPLFSPALLQQLLQTLPLQPTQCAYFQHYPLPVLLPRTEQLRQYLQQQLEAAQLATKQASLSIKRCLAQCFTDPVILTPCDPAGLDNVNTPQQWQQFQHKILSS